MFCWDPGQDAYPPEMLQKMRESVDEAMAKLHPSGPLIAQHRDPKPIGKCTGAIEENEAAARIAQEAQRGKYKNPVVYKVTQ
jgi:hypothetical protein